MTKGFQMKVTRSWLAGARSHANDLLRSPWWTQKIDDGLKNQQLFTEMDAEFLQVIEDLDIMTRGDR